MKHAFATSWVCIIYFSSLFNSEYNFDVQLDISRTVAVFLQWKSEAKTSWN